jgi:hypothetical protein
MVSPAIVFISAAMTSTSSTGRHGIVMDRRSPFPAPG